MHPKKKRERLEAKKKELLETEKKLTQSNDELNLSSSELKTQPNQSDSKTSPFKKLTRSLSGRDLRNVSEVPLTESVITNTLNELQAQGTIRYNWEGNTISATKNNDPTVHITIHTHDDKDKSWYQKPEIVKDILEFSSECDDDLKKQIDSIKNKK